MTALEGITLGIALLGACLGLLNTWHQYDQSRVKLRVRYLNRWTYPERVPFGFTIEVTNLSNFAITISEFGFCQSPWWHKDYERFVLIPDVNVTTDREFPTRLEPREQVSYYGKGYPEGRTAKRIRSVYARTSCGKDAHGTSPALRELADTLHENARVRTH